MSSITATTATNGSSRFQQALRAAFNSKLMHRLTYPHGPDRFIELFDPSLVSDETIGTITAIEHPTARSVRVQVRANDRWAGFLAGQHVEFAMEINGRRHKRMFSPAQSAHGRGALEFTMAVNPQGTLTRYIKNAASVGDRVVLGLAAGNFHMPSARPQQIVLISAGSGITPVLSMLRTLVDENHAGRVDFIHYCRNADDALYATVLAEISGALPGLRVHNIHTRDGGERFSEAQLSGLVPDYASAQTFVCGPAPLLEAIQTLFEQNGLSERLHYETFGLAPIVVDDADASGAVHFSRSNRQADNDGTTLLEQAEAAGLTPEFGCRMGVCFACTCNKTKGRVRDLRTGAISDDGEHEIQICVSQPVGPVSIDL